MADLGLTKTYSRPHTSDDNPYSEAQFKTLKYLPDFPERFGSIEDSRSFCQDFFPSYNKEHRHTGIGLHTPESVNYGLAQDIQIASDEVLRIAYEAHPERFGELPGTEILLQSGLPCFNDRTYRIRLVRQRPLSPQAFVPLPEPVRDIPSLLC